MLRESWDRLLLAVICHPKESTDLHLVVNSWQTFFVAQGSPFDIYEEANATRWNIVDKLKI